MCFACIVTYSRWYRMTGSNRRPSPCKGDARSSWANPAYHFSFEIVYLLYMIFIIKSNFWSTILESNQSISGCSRVHIRPDHRTYFIIIGRQWLVVSVYLSYALLSVSRSYDLHTYDYAFNFPNYYMVPEVGIEPTTLRVWTARSGQLSYSGI